MKPYGYVRADNSGIFIYGTDKFEPPQDVELVPVYLAREWVGLTDEQFQAIKDSLFRQDGWDGHGWDLALKEAIENKLRELNT
jgi:hypothetical protein